MIYLRNVIAIIYLFFLFQKTLYAAPQYPADTPQAKLDRSKVMENFSGRNGVNVSSGSELAGIVLGKMPILTESANVVLASPQIGHDVTICIRVTTRDGLFWSDNPFKTPNSDSTAILAGPVADKYLPNLQNYQGNDIFIRAIVPLTNDCSAPQKDSFIVPALGDPDGHLRAYLLTGGRAASARLKKQDDQDYQTPVRCEELPPGSTIAVDKVCTLPFPHDTPPGQYDLHIRMKGRVAMEDYRYVIHNPGRPK